MYIKRSIETDLLAHLQPGKAVILYGPRRVGKTTLMRKIRSGFPESTTMELSGDDQDALWLGSRSLETLRSRLGSTDLLLVDEAQQIPQIGLSLKLIVDHFPALRVLATGSSSFELARQIGEPLVGRAWIYHLYPLSQMELTPTENPSQTMARLPDRLIYGGFPEVFACPDLTDKQALLKSVVDNYLFRDLLILRDIRHADKLVDLLRLIAFQIGHEVSLRELSSGLSLNLDTVERYLDLLEKVFIIQRVHGYSRNHRKEITKTCRYYFLDNGLRNALINNFNPLDQRADVGQLWENYLWSERKKKNDYARNTVNSYFWRTYDQQEVDYVEESGGLLAGYEFKWTTRKTKEPKAWKAAYPEATWQTVSRDDYLPFISNS